jgi:uncharacterized membrane protein
LFFSLNSFSQEIKAELILISPPSVLKEGDILEGVLKVWPLENSNIDEFKKIENTTLAKFFYITEVEKVEPSINNSEVAEAKLLIIVKHSTGKDEQPLTFRDKVVNIIPPQLPMAPSAKASADYYVMNQEIAYSNLMAIIIAILIIMLMVLAYYKRISVRQFYKKLRNDSNSILAKRLKDKFANASKREDYEEIYAIRQEWQHLIETPSDSYNNFFKIIEMHQYKKMWSAEELLEVKNSFEPIRGSFA